MSFDTVEDLIASLQKEPPGTIVEQAMVHLIRPNGNSAYVSCSLPSDVWAAIRKAKLLAIGRFRETHTCE